MNVIPLKSQTNSSFLKLVASLDNNVLPSYSLVKNVIKSFDGDAEKFYPLFYKNILDMEHPFVGASLSHNCTVLLGFELANQVLCHLSTSDFKDDVLQVPNKPHTFSDKETSIISYLSGYIFSIYYVSANTFLIKKHMSPNISSTSIWRFFWLENLMTQKIYQSTNWLMLGIVAVYGKSEKR